MLDDGGGNGGLAGSLAPAGRGGSGLLAGDEELKDISLKFNFPSTLDDG